MKTLSHMARFLAILPIVALLLAIVPTTSHGQPPSPEDRGASIGKIVSSAIDVALPGISNLAKTILGIFKPSNNDPKKAQTEAAATAQAAATKKDAQSQLTALTEIADELKIVNGYTANSVNALYNLAQVEAIANKAALTNTDWNTLSAKWASFSGLLDAALKTSTQADVSQKVKDYYVRVMILKVFTVDNSYVKEIDADIKSKNLEDLRATLVHIRDPLTDLSLATGIELDRLANDIDFLAKAAKGGQPMASPFGTMKKPLKQLFVARSAARY